MLDQLLIKYVVGSWVILSISHRDWKDNGCLSTDGYLGIETTGAGGRGRKGEWVDGVRGVKHENSRILSP
jgi:hypothetical protein